MVFGPELITIRIMDDLKVLDRGLRYSSMEVENVTLRIVIPRRRLVVKFYEIVHVFTPPTF